MRQFTSCLCVLALMVTSRPCRAACGGHLTSDTGVITSPNYPDHYPNNLDCTWQIDVASSARIRFKFGDTFIENSFKCENDYLQITSGKFYLLNRCGWIFPDTLQTPGPSATVKFHSDSAASYMGFNLSYTVFVGNSKDKRIDDLIGTIAELGFKYDDLTNTVTRLRQCTTAHVAFTAGYTGDRTVWGKTVSYNQEIYNIGDSYNATTGVFTCKVAGLYNFAVHALSRHDNKTACFELTHNYRPVNTAYARDSYASGAASTSMNLELKVGDTVFVQGCYLPDHPVYVNNDIPSSNIFTGVLISSDTCV